MILGDSIRRRSGRRARPRDESGTGLGPRARLALVTVAIAIAGFFAAYLFATFVLYPPSEALGEAIEVPDLVGMSVEEAREVLRNAGLAVDDEVPIPDADRTRGGIVAQSPLGGQALRPGGGVRLAVSAGPPRLRVPNLLGFEEATAVAVLERAGFQVERSREIADEPAGRVARIQPAPGSEQEIPATIVLIISTGPPDQVTEDTSGVGAEPGAEAQGDAGGPTGAAEDAGGPDAPETGSGRR
ncbi:MAG TPA: PASTA domain-containing protein [Longimicrobiales bacterium]|nr:PASTA domain-containing protein [Longimicrobiales bacterium]